MTSTQFKELLDKYRSGSLNKAESDLLQQWLHQPGKRAALEALFDENLDDTAFQGVDDPELLNLIYQQISIAMNPQEPEQGKWRKMKFFRIAAAAVVVLALGGLWLWWQDMPASSKPDSTVAQQQTDVSAPQETRALLTLADGRVIPLDSMRQGLIAAEGNAQIEKQSNGEIKYNSSGTAGSIAWNTITVPRGSKPVQLVLADGSKVWLNVASSMRYPVAFNTGARKVAISGEAYFEIAEKNTNDKDYPKNRIPFIVNIHSSSLSGARKGQVEVLGTHFNVNAYEDEQIINTSLMEGSVKVTPEPAAFPPATLKPGQQARFPVTGKEPVTVHQADMDEVLAWKNGRFSFAGESLPVIMRQLARWYNLEVVFENNITDPYTISISRDVPLSKLIQFIELSGGVSIEMQGNKLLVRKGK